MQPSGSGDLAPFRLLGDLSDVKTIAVGKGVKVLGRLVKQYGQGRWRKRKGVGQVQLPDGSDLPSGATLV